jgi:hypothetical protein
MSSIFSTLNIPSITVKALKDREREIGKTLESTIASICEEAITEELNLTK